MTDSAAPELVFHDGTGVVIMLGHGHGATHMTPRQVAFARALLHLALEELEA
jgi:hypothetical protein